MIRILKGVLITVLVLAGILLISNVDKGVERYARDRIQVMVGPGTPLEAVVLKFKGTRVINEEKGIVGIPEDEAMFYVRKFEREHDVMFATQIPVPPQFKFSVYQSRLKKMIQNYTQGDLGSITYKTNPGREYPVLKSLGDLVARSFSYLLPGLALGLITGFLLALAAVWKPRLGQVLDGLHNLVLGMPDFFIVVLLQLLAIQVAKAVGHKVFVIYQFVDEVPFLIPMLAISILPAALIYGALRLSVEREWQESYIKTAAAKGLTRNAIILHHILRNTLEDLLTILPRAVSVSITSLVVAEVMTMIFGLGGYAVNPKINSVSSLPVTCAILALFALFMHWAISLLRKKMIVNTKEGV